MLEGIRVLDLTWVLGGPFAGQLLAQLGAEVIKIEPPAGDLARRFPPHYVEGDSTFYLSVNRGKKSVALDLKQAEAQTVFRRLVARADAVIYGFAPDVPPRLGLDAESLLQINPRLCIGQLIGLHDRGEYASMPAYDIIIQALAGFMSITGEPEGRPVRAGYQVADLAGGLYLALGLLGALLQAARRGRGRLVQVSLLDCQLAMLTWQAQNYFASGEVPRATGTRHPMVAPSEVFRCADDGYIAISPTTAGFWQSFCAAVGRPELAGDARFQDHHARIANVEELAAILREVFAAKDAAHWTRALQAARVPVGRVNDVAEALAQPLAVLRGMVESLPGANGEAVQFLGNPFKTTPPVPELGYPPRLGAHTREVLAELGDCDTATLQRLQAAGAILCAD